MARLAVFLGCILSAAWLFGIPRRGMLPALVLTAAAVCFLALVALHRRAREAQARARALCELNRRGVARCRRDWSALPPAREAIAPSHPYAADLDVAGSSASLYRLIDVVTGATGRPVLLRWLLDRPPETAQLVSRQAAVSELAKSVDVREELALLGRHSRETSGDQFEKFLTWAEGDTIVARRTGLLWGSRVIPVLTLATTVLALLGRLPWSVPFVCVLSGLLVLGIHRATLSAGLTSVLANATGLRGQRRMFERLASSRFTSSYLLELRDRTRGGADALASLERTMALIEGRGSLIHTIANAIVLWDVHAAWRLDRWRDRHGRGLRACLTALGEVEAVAALGTLAHDNPSWTFPTFDANARALTATALGHPLLPATIRVENDVTVGPPGSLLLVTGSNMSGKSTLLRSIGLNVVLAQAGAPVCAARLTLPPLELRTSIRLADSLERGVSLFMAELERLKEIVDAARVPSRDRLLLYLLDEILHGTNSAERLIAARAVLGHLVHAGAIGAVTTHDLTLAADGELATASRAVHFTELVSNGATDGPRMTFDYRLRPGLATSTNALKLLALVGLGDAAPNPPVGGRPA